MTTRTGAVTARIGDGVDRVAVERGVSALRDRLEVLERRALHSDHVRADGGGRVVGLEQRGEVAEVFVAAVRVAVGDEDADGHVARAPVGGGEARQPADGRFRRRTAAGVAALVGRRRVEQRIEGGARECRVFGSWHGGDAIM